MLENFSTIRNSNDSKESVDSLRDNQEPPPSLEQLNYRAKQQKRQRKSHEKIESEEHRSADFNLSNELSLLDVSMRNNENKKLINKDQIRNKELSNEDRIKNFTQSIQQGKSQTEILSLLISKFENEESVSTWVENWRNFQKLHNFAQDKPPAERQAIQNIIAKADFSSENAFVITLNEIEQSNQVSNATKLEISQKFGGERIDSVDGLNFRLQEIKSQTKALDKEIEEKNSAKNSLDSDIQSLEDELEKLPLGDPRRTELEEKIEQKKAVLEQTEKEIDRLKKGKPKEISFPLREGFTAKLNPDGSRSIQLDENFAIKIPSNRLPFTDTKNLRSINLAFPFKILRDLKIADYLFIPNLENNSIPTKSQRDMGHLILSSLGIDDTKILSGENIAKLRKDLSFLNPENGKTGLENLIELGVWDVEKRELNHIQLLEVLKKIRQNGNLTQ